MSGRSRGSRPVIRASGLGVALALVLGACGGGSATGSSLPPASGSLSGAVPTEAPPTSPPSASPTSPPASPSPDPYAFAALFEGTYRGTWTNTTFGSSGSAKLEIALDRADGALVVTMTLGGNVFGQPAPKPESITARITAGGLAFTSRTFGPSIVSLKLDGAAPVITVRSPDVPSQIVKTFTATATIRSFSTIDFAYTLTFRNGLPNAKGTAILKR